MTQTDELREKAVEVAKIFASDFATEVALTSHILHLMEQVRADERERLVELAEFQAGYAQPAALAFEGWTTQYQKDAYGAARWIPLQGDKP